ncbi:MAG: hypothetical protein ACOYOK_01215 [Pseudobdellovibrionaceae bacterium]
MKSIFTLFISLFLGLMLMGCTHGHCVAKTSKDAKEGVSMNTTVGELDKVKIYKLDGSLQCNQGKSISAEEMQKELSGLQVFSAKNTSDGKMHIQMCGSPTGKCNVYQIHRKDLAEALKRGFKEWVQD